LILPDANVLIYSFRRDAGRHSEYLAWLKSALLEEQAVGISEFVLSSVVRVTTHPSIFKKPSAIEETLAFCDTLLSQPNVLRIVPGERHWSIFSRISRAAGVRGNLVPDAYLAALAIEHGAELITTDRDFARFSGLRWRHPLP